MIHNVHIYNVKKVQFSVKLRDYVSLLKTVVQIIFYLNIPEHLLFKV